LRGQLLDVLQRLPIQAIWIDDKPAEGFQPGMPVRAARAWFLDL